VLNEVIILSCLEGKLQDFVETSSDLFDQGKSVTDNGDKKKKTPFKKQMQKLKDRIDQEGNVVTIIKDY
jgi:hypothetical protein